MQMQPLFNEWKATIEKYGNGGFVIAGEEVRGSVLLTLSARHDLAVDSVDQLTAEIIPALQQDGTELLLVGCGTQVQPLPETLRTALRTAGIACELMDTGAACRTYGIVQSEERRAAALLIAV
jgi:uncharacterized protein